MKKYIILSVFVSTLLVAGSLMAVPAHAQEASTTTTTSCYALTRNLGEGRSINSQEAATLAKVLSDAGVWDAGTPITAYTEEVASAVSGFQQKYASQILTPNKLTYGTGFVGASTRAEINSLSGCTVTSTAADSNDTIAASTANIDPYAFSAMNRGNGAARCPAGYTCTRKDAAPAPFVCPAGYTCNPIGSKDSQPTNVSPVSDYTNNSYSYSKTYYSSSIAYQGPTFTTADGVTLDTKLVDASQDKISGDFNLGAGFGNRNPNDWHWSASISSSQAKTISTIFIQSNTGGEGWSTTDSNALMGKVLYPIKVLLNSSPLNSSYNQNFSLPSGHTSYDLYGQPETTPFAGGTITIIFSDGTGISSNIQPSSITQSWANIQSTPPIPTTPYITPINPVNACPTGYNCSSTTNNNSNNQTQLYISSISPAFASFAAGQSGTWIVNSIDTKPNYGGVLYSADWGDQSTTPGQSINSFTHTYANPGVYTATFTVREIVSGISVQATSVVKVGNPVQTQTAKASLSVDASNPPTVTVAVSDTTNGQYLALPILTFDINSQTMAALKAASVQVTSSRISAVTAAYLYQGSNLIASASVSGGVASFSNINGVKLQTNTATPFTVKVDISGIPPKDTSTTVVASVSSDMVTLQDTNGTAVVLSGSVSGNTITVTNN